MRKGKVLAVNISEKKGTIKKSVPQIELLVGQGIANDAHAGPWHRQVSLLDDHSVERMRVQGAKGLVPGIFAENITTSGLNLEKYPIGTLIQINDVRLRVTQIGKECHQHCQIYRQVGNCVMPLEGIFAEVLQGGTVKAEDPIEVTFPIKAAILTLSDKAFAGEREDRSGPALAEALADKAEILEVKILPDDLEEIKAALIHYADELKPDLVFTTGGTGLAPRDITPEATKAVCERMAPGITEAMRIASLKITDKAMLSRATAGVRGRTLIINLPGSPKAALECLQVFLPVMEHAVETLRGDAFECGRT